MSVKPGGDLVFGPAHADDVDALVAIDADSPRPWTAQAFSTELEVETPALFVLRESAQAVAFVVARIHGPEMDIVNFAVAPVYRRHGLGRRLLRSFLDHAAASGVEAAFLEVREGNVEARALYGSAGFTETQRRRGFYEGPQEDALLLRLQMSPMIG
ncbi:MAG: ribosomal protein S18-alanine N-acetyltransferase [Vicinamibacteria bacterium]|nr:ribosomal protein S18-alanine N-acetyltransferase [Vicinamibacteria bacterium]